MCRQSFITSFAILTFALLAACIPAYTPEYLQQIGAKEDSGLVVKQSHGSFVLKTENGTETIFRTGQMTQYLPAKYRSGQGDSVRVAYHDVLERSGRVKHEVLQLEAITIAEQNRQLPNPIVGTVVATGHGSIDYSVRIAVRYRDDAEPLPIYLPISTVSVTRDGQPAAIAFWSSLVGSQVSVVAERIPIRRGNALIYVAKSIDVISTAPQ
jgi:hypothetical protein